MSPNVITEYIRRRPFEPFRLEVSDGSHYDILHPELCMVGMSHVAVGVPLTPTNLQFERLIQIDCRHIVKAYLLPPALASGNGQAS